MKPEPDQLMRADGGSKSSYIDIALQLRAVLCVDVPNP